MRPLTGIFPTEDYADLLIGLNEPDDSAVYRLNAEQAIITTTDFFPPVVDDYYAFGAIAAANALSDVYAMGGKPIMAINLVAFPDGLDLSILTEIMRGGAEKVREAGAVIAGGHTVTDKEPKYGLSVTGEIHPNKIIQKGGAKPGNKLILTKPLGTGVITTALKQDKVNMVHVEAAIRGMSHLNKVASELAQQFNEQHSHCVHAMTDITGYSLLGHSHEMAHLSKVAFRIRFDDLQWYPGALRYAQDDLVPGGTHRNQEYFSQWVPAVNGLTEWQESLLYDPQTSGGLLMAVQADRAYDLLDSLLGRGEQAAIIGDVVEGNGQIHIL